MSAKLLALSELCPRKELTLPSPEFASAPRMPPELAEFWIATMVSLSQFELDPAEKTEE